MQNQLFEQLLITQQMPAHWSLVTSYTGHSKLHGQWRATTIPWTLESSHLRVSGKARYIRKNGEAKREEGLLLSMLNPRRRSRSITSEWSTKRFTYIPRPIN